MGSVLGGVVGHLFDQAADERRGGFPERGTPARQSAPRRRPYRRAALPDHADRAGRGGRPPGGPRAGSAGWRCWPPGSASVSRCPDQDPALDRDASSRRWTATGSGSRWKGCAPGTAASPATRVGCCWCGCCSRSAERSRGAGRMPGGSAQVADLLGRAGGGPTGHRRRPAWRGQPYAVLGLPPEADDGQVSAAWRRLARRHHPDRVASLGEAAVREAEERFKQVRAAYEAIRRYGGGDATQTLLAVPLHSPKASGAELPRNAERFVAGALALDVRAQRRRRAARFS